MNRRHIVLVSALSLSIGLSVFSGCTAKKSSSSDDSASTTEEVKPITTLAEIPRIVSQLGHPRSTSTATTGLKLTDVDNTDVWTTGKSRAMCELAFIARETYMASAANDSAVCIMGELEARDKFEKDPNVGAYDNGSDWVYDILVDYQYARRLKFKITKNYNRHITDLTLAMCKPTGGSSFSQTNYILFSNQSDTASFFTRSLGESGTKSWWAELSASGLLNAASEWIQMKTIEGKLHAADTAGSKTFDQRVTLYQYVDDLKIIGYSLTGATGVLNDSDVKIYGEMNLINPETAGTIALGDGTAIADMIYGNSNVGYGYMSWTGETRAAASTSPYFNVVSEYEPKNVLYLDNDPVTPGFGETGDCDSPSPPKYSLGIELTASEWAEIQSICSAHEMGPDETRGAYTCGGI